MKFCPAGTIHYKNTRGRSKCRGAWVKNFPTPEIQHESGMPWAEFTAQIITSAYNVLISTAQLCRSLGDGASNTVEDNSSIFSLIGMCWLPSVLWHCWLDGRKGIRPVKNGEMVDRWAMVSPDGVAPTWMVGVSAPANLPLHHKVHKFTSGTGSPGWSRKKGP